MRSGEAHHLPRCGTAGRITASLAILIGCLAVQPALADNAATSGDQVFKQGRCFACHGDLGHGGAGPRLQQNIYLSLDDYVITKLLLGRGIMPAFGEQFSDQQIAAVASYIRNSWGNHYGEVSAEQVAKQRKALNGNGTPEADNRNSSPGEKR